METGLSDSVAEGLNNKIETAVKRSYGSKTAKYRNIVIYLVAGKLDLFTGLAIRCWGELENSTKRDAIA